MSAPLDSRQLKAFTLVAQTGSFTEASKQLHLSQSAVSHSIRVLEEDVGCRLLERAGKKVFLTQAGEHLLKHATHILQEMEAVRGDLEHLGQWGHGRLRLAASATACEYILPSVLREFKESFPQCSIIIEPGDSPAALDLILAGRVDLAMVLEPRSEPNLEFRHLFTDELIYVTSPQHPWALAERVNRAEVARQNFILYHKNSYTVRLIENYFADEKLNLPSFMEMGSMEAMKELVKLGLGISILTPWVARKELEEGSLVGLPLGKRKLRRNWGIVHWRERRLTLAEETFVGICQTVTKSFE
jgi:DNA-binding transcriptional LysR family regulator